MPPSEPGASEQAASEGGGGRDRLAVVATGDPRAPRTWSGAPAALVAALERQGFDVVGIDAGTHGWARLPHLVRYHSRRWWHSPLRAKVDLRLQRDLLGPGVRSDLHWDLRLRERRARRAMDQVARAGVAVVLHCTANAIPRRCPPGVRQLAYLDSTWSSQTSHRVPGGAGRYPPALVEEGTAHERRSHAQLEHVFAMGAWFEAEVEALGVPPERITNVGTGIVHGDRAPSAPEEPYRMLVAAKDLVDERGVRTAVEAFALARRQEPRLRLVVVGSAEAARRFGGTPGVEVHPYVDREALDVQLDRASLLVLPAQYQVWGMIYLEAMAARTPVLAVDRFAAREITEGGSLGFLVEAQDPTLVAAAMLDAFSDLERLAKLGEASRRSVLDRFSWDGVAAKMAAVIREADESAG